MRERSAAPGPAAHPPPGRTPPGAAPSQDTAVPGVQTRNVPLLRRTVPQGRGSSGSRRSYIDGSRTE